MVGFVVPIKPKAVSKDWELDNRLLERTTRSICAQTDQNFRLIIVHNDPPRLEFSHPNIVSVPYPYPAVAVHEIEDLEYVLRYHPREYAERMMDKGKKIHFGCKTAIEAGCTHMMAIDSDDLISNRLAAFVNERAGTGSPGWIIRKGFIYEENSFMLLEKYDMQNINGGTHIIRKDLITIPDFASNLFWNYNLFEAHGYTWYRIKDYHGEILEDYPRFGIVYVIHKSNYSNISQLTSAVTLRNVIKKIVRGKRVSDDIRQEFGLYRLDAS